MIHQWTIDLLDDTGNVTERRACKSYAAALEGLDLLPADQAGMIVLTVGDINCRYWYVDSLDCLVDQWGSESGDVPQQFWDEVQIAELVA